MGPATDTAFRNCKYLESSEMQSSWKVVLTLSGPSLEEPRAFSGGSGGRGLQDSMEAPPAEPWHLSLSRHGGREGALGKPVAQMLPIQSDFRESPPRSV